MKCKRVNVNKIDCNLAIRSSRSSWELPPNENTSTIVCVHVEGIMQNWCVQVTIAFMRVGECISAQGDGAPLPANCADWASTSTFVRIGTDLTDQHELAKQESCIKIRMQITIAWHAWIHVRNTLTHARSNREATEISSSNFLSALKRGKQLSRKDTNKKDLNASV